MPRAEDGNDKGDYKTYWDNVQEVHQVCQDKISTQYLHGEPSY